MATIINYEGRSLLVGTAGNDTLNDYGYSGTTMIGGAGNDTYIVYESSLPIIIETATGGVDTVKDYSQNASIEFAANVENLTLLNNGDDSMRDGYGNEGANIIIGVNGTVEAQVDNWVQVDVSAIDLDTNTNFWSNLYAYNSSTSDYYPVSGSVYGSVDVYAYGSLWVNVGTTEQVAVANNLYGYGGNDTLIGGQGDDHLDGGTGVDDMRGGKGSDSYVVDNVLDKVTENAGEGDDDTVLLDFHGADAAHLQAVTYTLGANVEDLFGDYSSNASFTLTGNAANNHVFGDDFNDKLSGLAGDDRIMGFSGNDTLDGGDGNDDLDGGDGNDIMLGGAGNDFLEGGYGDDTMTGGLGDDTYFVDSVAYSHYGHVSSTGDVVIEAAAGGDDTVIVDASSFDMWSFYGSGVRYTLSANVENLVFENTQYSYGYGYGYSNIDVTGTGNDSNNYLQGGLGNDTLSGGKGDDVLDGSFGADRMLGGLGNDTFVVDNSYDRVVENLSEGTDTVISSVDFVLGANVENLTLVGNDSAFGTGNELNNNIIGSDGFNLLNGGAGNDTIDGGAGADFMVGGLGNDTFYVDDQGDMVAELKGAGADTVISSVSHLLAANVENLTLIGSKNLAGRGNALANTLTGNAGNNWLNGGGNDKQIDKLIGGLGDDTYVVWGGTGAYLAVVDAVTELAGQGTDSVVAYGMSSYTLNTLVNANVENLTLGATSAITVDGTGNALNNRITGNAADNTLDGGAGNDTLDGGFGADLMIGGAGNDTFYVDNAADSVQEAALGGTDTVILAANIAGYNLDANAYLKNVDNLTALGAGTFTGNGLANTMDAANGVANTLIGGAGNDIYLVDGGDCSYSYDTHSYSWSPSMLDTVIEASGGGTDLVKSLGDYTLAAMDNVENLTLLNKVDEFGAGDSERYGEGNGLANTITGVDGTVIVEPGTPDSYTVAVNNHLSGGSGNDTLIGGQGDDFLDGGIGADKMTGGKGNDYYRVDNPLLDTIVENTNEGYWDTVSLAIINLEGNPTSVSYALGANIEGLFAGESSNVKFTLTGNALGNDISGGILDDKISGGLGDDYLGGESGNDTLDGGDGNDEMWGGNGNDILLGGAGNDFLDGGAGNDTMTGGDGNDTYYVDSSSDVVSETNLLAAGGIDTVKINKDAVVTSYTLGANVENLDLDGDSYDGSGYSLDAFDGYGNGLANTIWGNLGDNTISGLAGNDTLYDSHGLDYGDGAGLIITHGGGDTMIGGDGNDTINMYNLDSNDMIDGGAGSDELFINTLSRDYNGYAYNFVATLDSTDVETINIHATSNDNGTYSATIIDMDIVTGASLVNLSTDTGIDFAGYGGAGIVLQNLGTGISVGLTGGDTHTDLGGGATLGVMVGLADETGVSDSLTFNVDTFCGFIDTENLGTIENLTFNLTSGVHSLIGLGTNAQASDITVTGDMGDLSLYGMGSTTLTLKDFAGGIEVTYGNAALTLALDNVAAVMNTDVETIEITSVGAADNSNSLTLFGYGASLTVLHDVAGDQDLTLVNVIGNVNADTFTGDLMVFANNSYGGVELVGGAGDDWLMGGSGEDLLVGGLGSDTLNGGVGADIFGFTSALGITNIDTIEDFVSGSDNILLAAGIFAELSFDGGGVLEAACFQAYDGGLDGDSAYIEYEQGTGNLYYDDGAGVTTLFANIYQGNTITNADIVTPMA